MRFTFILVSLFCGFTAFAGTARIQGLVKDASSADRLEYASVALYRVSDNSLVNGTITGKQGSFSFENLDANNYFIKVQFLGYENKQTESFTLKNGESLELGEIAISPSSQLVNEVAVTGTKINALNRLEKQTYSASQFESAKGGSAVDVLKNMPSVSVNGQGEISMRGSSGFLLLINGKPVLGDPQNMLSQLPANSIKNVELITSPSAKFDPDGKGGIINITTIQGTADLSGWSINLQQGFPSTTTYNNLRTPIRFGGDINYTYQKGKWDISAGVNYTRNDLTGFREGNVYTINFQGNTINKFPSNGERSYYKYNYAGRASIAYTADKNNIFTVGVFAGKRYQERDANLFYTNSQSVYDTKASIYSLHYYNKNNQIKEGTFTLGNFDYTHKFADQSALTFSALYEYDDLWGNTFNRNMDKPDGNVIQFVQNPYSKPVDGYRLKLDYSAKLGNGKLETGYQFRNDSQDGFFDYIITPANPNQPNLNQFKGTAVSKNQINSLYAQYSAKIDKFEYVAGLRYEYSKRSVVLSTDPATHNLNLSNLFPSVSALYSITDGLKVKAGFSRRIERQSNNQLNPIPEREHSETLEIGDPDLKPELINLAELGLIKTFTKGSVFGTAYYRASKDPMQRVNSIYADTILARVYTNVEKASALGFELGGNIQPVKGWSLYLGGNLYKQKYTGNPIVFGQKIILDPKDDWVYSINMNTNVNFSSTLSMQANLNYLSVHPTAQGEDSRFLSPNLSVKKSLFKNKMTASIQWQNIDLGMHESNRQRITTWGTNFYTTTNYIYETDVVMLNLSFNLNKKNNNAKLPQSEFGEKEF